MANQYDDDDFDEIEAQEVKKQEQRENFQRRLSTFKNMKYVVPDASDSPLAVNQ